MREMHGYSVPSRVKRSNCPLAIQGNSVTKKRLQKSFSLPRNEQKRSEGLKDHVFILFKVLSVMCTVSFMYITPGPSGQGLNQ